MKPYDDQVKMLESVIETLEAQDDLIEKLFKRFAYYITWTREFRERVDRDVDGEIVSQAEKTELIRRDSMTHAIQVLIADLGLSEEFWIWFRQQPAGTPKEEFLL